MGSDQVLCRFSAKSSCNICSELKQRMYDAPFEPHIYTTLLSRCAAAGCEVLEKKTKEVEITKWYLLSYVRA